MKWRAGDVGAELDDDVDKGQATLAEYLQHLGNMGNK